MRKEKKHLKRMDCCIRLFCHRLDKETTEDRDNHGIPLVSDGLPPCHPRLAIRLGRAWGKDENRIWSGRLTCDRKKVQSI